MTRQRIAFVINSLGPGGAERVMMTVLEHAPRERYDVNLILLDREEEHRIPPDFVTVHRLDCAYRLFPSITALRGKLREIAPDLVVSFLVRANIAAVVATGTLRIPVIISERAQLSTHLAGRHGKLRAFAAKLVPRLVYPHADHIIAVSSGVRADLIAKFGITPADVTSIPNPYDVPALTAAAAAPPEIPLPARFMVSAGRLTESKGYSDLIDAYARANPPLPLVILGQGEQRDMLQARITAAGLTDRIHLAGYARNPFAIVARADLFVSASHCEGFPNAMAEAMALGVPVVATDCPSGPSELLDETDDITTTVARCARHGILAPVKTSAALADAITLMLAPETLAHYRRQARIRIADFSLARAMERYWTCFATVLGDKAPVAATMAASRAPGASSPEQARASG